MKAIVAALIFSIIPLSAFAGWSDFDRTDKILFSSVVVSQIADGLTTAATIKNGNGIHETFAWKYGASHPSPGRLWTVKAAELCLAYVVAGRLSGPYRKAFLGCTAALLIYCAANNGLSFSITY